MRPNAIRRWRSAGSTASAPISPPARPVGAPKPDDAPVKSISGSCAGALIAIYPGTERSLIDLTGASVLDRLVAEWVGLEGGEGYERDPGAGALAVDHDPYSLSEPEQSKAAGVERGLVERQLGAVVEQHRSASGNGVERAYGRLHGGKASQHGRGMPADTGA